MTEIRLKGEQPERTGNFVAEEIIDWMDKNVLSINSNEVKFPNGTVMTLNEFRDYRKAVHFLDDIKDADDSIKHRMMHNPGEVLEGARNAMAMIVGTLTKK